MKFRILSNVLILAAFGGPLAVNAANVRTFDPANFTQIIQTVNLLANTNIGTPESTATPVTLEYFIGSDRCWDTGYYPVNYKNHFSFGACPSCGCRAAATKVVITPLPKVGKLKAAYEPSTFYINTDPKITATQMVIIQDQPPIFDPQSGEVDKPGTIKIKSQEQ